MRVYRVATKGQEEGGSNWVTSYYLAFSSDGVSYSNYTQGQNRPRVSVILNTVALQYYILGYCAGKKSNAWVIKKIFY